MRSHAPKIFLAALLSLILTAVAYCQQDYRDGQSGITVSLPEGWIWSNQPRHDQKTRTEVVVFQDSAAGAKLNLYMQTLDPPEAITAADKINRRLLKQAQAKVRQRLREGYENYHLREGSLDSRAISGHSALTWVADYTENGREMVECLTRARSENTNAIFYARAPAEQLADLKTNVDPIIETLQIP